MAGFANRCPQTWLGNSSHIWSGMGSKEELPAAGKWNNTVDCLKHVLATTSTQYCREAVSVIHDSRNHLDHKQNLLCPKQIKDYWGNSYFRAWASPTKNRCYNLLWHQPWYANVLRTGCSQQSDMAVEKTWTVPQGGPLWTLNSLGISRNDQILLPNSWPFMANYDH